MLTGKRRKSLGLVPILIGLWFCSCWTLFSQTTLLQFRNGDRLSGKIISESTNQVVIKTTWAPALIVPLSEIAKREILPSSQVAITNLQTNVTATIVTTTVSGTSTNITTNFFANLASPKPADVKPKEPRHWHGDVQIGTDLGFSEKQRQLYYGRFKITYAHEVAPRRFFKNTFDLNGTYGRTDGITSANQVAGTSKAELDLTKRVFIYSLVGSGYDEIRKIDFQYEVGPGVGYHVLMQTNFVLNTEFGFNYQAQYFDNQPELERYFYRLAEDFKWVISKKLSFDEKFEFFPVDNLRQYRFRFESNLRYTFLDNVIFTLTVLDAYDTQSAIGVSPNDLQVRSSLGLKF